MPNNIHCLHQEKPTLNDSFMSHTTLDEGAVLLSKQASQPLLGDAADPVETTAPTLRLPPSTETKLDPADASESFGSLQHLCFIARVCFANTD